MAIQWDGREWINDFLPPYGRIATASKKSKSKKIAKKLMTRTRPVAPTAPKKKINFDVFRTQLLILCSQEPPVGAKPPEPNPSKPAAPEKIIPAISGGAVRSIVLYYTDLLINSDKVYQLDIVSMPGSLFHVNYANGKRGKSLRTGRKTSVPVSMAEAVRIFDALVKEKKGEGYTENVSGKPYSR